MTSTTGIVRIEIIKCSPGITIQPEPVRRLTRWQQVLEYLKALYR